MARNCHKSVFNALYLGDIEPIYVYPETLEKYGVLGGVSPEEIEKCLEENPDAQAVIVASPNYYGICSDIASIAEKVHSKGKILIVDQAHGAHLRLFSKYGIEGFPKSAEEQGADLVINSIHKTLASWTQSAIINVCSDRVDLFALEDKLQMIESSSPSYPMMASLDINADILLGKGPMLMKEWADNLNYFYEEARKISGLTLMDTTSLDKTKMNLDMSAYGLNGNRLEDFLMEKDIFIELITGNIVMCMSGIGNSRKDFQRLLNGLKEITRKCQLVGKEAPKQPRAVTKALERRKLPQEKVFLSLENAMGKVCASSIIPYPPGIPIACPGEILDEEIIAYIKERRAAEEKVIGVTAEGMVLVGK